MPLVTGLLAASEVDGPVAQSNTQVTRAVWLNTAQSLGAPINHAFSADGVDDHFPLEPILSAC